MMLIAHRCPIRIIMMSQGVAYRRPVPGGEMGDHQLITW